MKHLLLSALTAAAVIASVRAQAQNNMAPGKVPVYTFEQKPVAGLPVLIDPQRAQVIVDEFKNHYPALGNPRILIFVQDLDSGTTITNRRAVLARRQTLLDVQRLVARPFRIAGATLVDKGITNEISSTLSATALLENKSDRDAVAHVADVVIEAQISSHTVSALEPSLKTFTVPDLQLTAIRVSDAKILGQVSASDLLSRAGGPGYVALYSNVQDITESAAIALMDATLRVQ